MRRPSQIDIFTNKLPVAIDNLNNPTILRVFFTHFDLESVLSLNTHSWKANIFYSQGVAEALSVFSTHSFYLSSQLFILYCMTNILRQMKKFLIELMDRIPNFIALSIDWYVSGVGWIHFLFSGLFSRGNCIWSPCFLFIKAWLSLDTSGETTSWITFVFSLLCWE